MSLDDSDQWFQSMKETRGVLNRRFPMMKCLRCGKDNFFMRVWDDRSLSPAFADTRVMELICSNCGLQEKHVMAQLDNDVRSVAERLDHQDG